MKSKYQDNYYRFHERPTSEEMPYTCGNAFLFSGEAYIMGLITEEQSKVIDECFELCRTEYGYIRNPNGVDMSPSSQDEIIGNFMRYGKDQAKSELKRLKKQHFQVCNLEGFKPKRLLSLNPFKVFKQFRSLANENHPRLATPKYPYIWPIIFRHAPQHTYFYVRRAGAFINPIHSLYTFLAGLHTIHKGSNSSRVLLGFKLLSLKQLGWTFMEKMLVKAYNKNLEFNFEVGMYFPDDYPVVTATKHMEKL